MFKLNKTKKLLASCLAVTMAGTITAAAILANYSPASSLSAGADAATITRLDNVKSTSNQYFDEEVVQHAPDTVLSNEEISVIVKMSTDSLMTAFDNQSKASVLTSVAEFSSSASGNKVLRNIESERQTLRHAIEKAGVSYKEGENYDVLFGGFEVLIKAKDFEALNKAIGKKATLIIGEVYEKCETQVVNNDVNVHSTGIFNSEGSGYDGSGTVIAVLDTGLDYTHSAFDISRFEGEDKAVIDLNYISERLSNLRASAFTSGLNAEDVYYNAKVPYMYDYADRDADVYPIQSEHGTHVSGVIVGNDNTITGVAPNAQLVSMKVFSDADSGAKTSWILAALEDCAILEVDVINMSLGTSAGFSREADNDEINRIYDEFTKRGISLVCAASNDYNATFGSEKNGNLGLTSNPDSATVGSPSTFEAALSVASVSGVKTPYMLYGNTVMYFTEASGLGAKRKEFVNEILGANENEKEFEYVTIPGVGRTADYSGFDVAGKIALVKRGQTTFEEKTRVAYNQGAKGIIIYNNVSGDISMTVGGVDFPVCSISQDNGEILAAKESGKIKISRSQVAGPFMSDFSSWGPTPDLRIKPEITAHGGEILSAVPGQAYDRLSGTSMASPNQAGVTALVRQYVKETFPSLNAVEVAARVNQLMMSTADIVYNKNGLPYAVRKQGSGLANLTKVTSTKAFISTYGSDDNIMNKAKLELGDDAKKTGVYTMKFDINNIGSSSLTYDIGALVITEGVSGTLTVRGDTTVTEEGYLLNPAVEVTGVKDGLQNGNSVTVSGSHSATVTVKITLSDEDKAYLDKSFANGMYVEGFITLTSKDANGVNLNVPLLAFYGDWTQAPLFDLDYFDTNKDELDNGIDQDDKTMADAYATRPVGGLYNDFIAYLGSYAYVQNPTATKIAADRKYIALSNYATGDEAGSVHSLYGVWAGMLRGAKRIVATVTNSVTGEEIYKEEVYNVRKSFNSSGSIRPASIDLNFDLANFNLKNNTQYTVKLVGYVDYGDGGLETNLNNTFEFPFVTDFEAPVVTGCDFYTEYDSSTKKTRLFANISIYDNHYSQAAMLGYVSNEGTLGKAEYYLHSFGRYLSALYSDFNSNYVLNYELTDYIDDIKDSHDGRSFIVEAIDYALNSAVYEITIPDSVASIEFLDADGNDIDELILSPNEIFTLNPVIFPDTSWAATLNYKTSKEGVVNIVNDKLVAIAPGEVTVTAISNANETIKKSFKVIVLSPSDEGYVAYDKPVADSFTLTGYTVNKVFYFISSEDRDLGASTAGQTVQFTGSSTSYSLSMFPSESITINYKLDAYFPDDVKVVFSSSNSNVTVDENGKITAQSKGSGTIYINVTMDGKNTLYSRSIRVTVKDPYEVTSIYLMKYTGLGGVVEIPGNLGFTQIFQYAFSNYEYVAKGENDEVSKEDPLYTKPVPIGENTITKVIIPEGVEVIGAYAFAYLTALEEVVLPSTLKRIEVGAFQGCTELKTVNFEHVQFINQYAFADCKIEEGKFDKIVAFGDYSFQNNSFKALSLPETAQSIGAGAFYHNKELRKLEIKASRVKLGSMAFAGCEYLQSVTVNASVIPTGVFQGCSSLTDVFLGKDVSVVGAYAFAGANISSFNVASGNKILSTAMGGAALVGEKGTLLIAVAPNLDSFTDETSKITAVGDGAFSGNEKLTYVNLPNVTKVGSYAFASCTALTSANLHLGALEEIGNNSFYACRKLNETPSLSGVTSIGDYAFYGSGVQSVNVANNTEIGIMAFAYCNELKEVTVGSDVVIGNYAFFTPTWLTDKYECYEEHRVDSTTYHYYLRERMFNTSLTSFTAGSNVTIGAGAFENAAKLTDVSLGAGATIGDYAFYNNEKLESIDLSSVKKIGDYAFSGDYNYVYVDAGYCHILNDISDLSLYGIHTQKVYSSKLTNVNLSALTHLGAGAFANVFTLSEVTIGKAITEIPDEAFLYTALTAFDFENITKIGNFAFAVFSGMENPPPSIQQANLSSVDEIGIFAFDGAAKLTSVTLKEGVKIGDYAFSGTTALATINLSAAKEIGAYAFAGSALTNVTADLINAEYIGEYAFYLSGLKGKVTLGASLTRLGDNPFALTKVEEFTDERGSTNSFKLNNSVFVDENVLYLVAPNGGYVLITYPALKEGKFYNVLENTVRVSGLAFAYATLQTVQLPVELGAIGDKAFFGCSNLTLVVFKSVSAPILEEELDTNYINAFAGTGGLEIIEYRQWNQGVTSFYYGANFIDYIGYAPKIVMVRPSNGTGYGSFIYNQYFDVIIDGAVAPLQTTLDAIKAIAALPDYITLAHKAQVAAARELYNKVTLDEQKALVTNYSKLTAAEDMITYLEGLIPADPVDPKPTKKGVDPLILTLSIFTGFFGASAIALAVLYALVMVKKNKALEKNKTKRLDNDEEA